MIMIKAQSSTIKEYGFEMTNAGAQVGTLRVIFNNGGTYEFDAVPASTFDAMSKEKSKGKFFGQFIRGKFNTRKIEITDQGGKK